MIYAQDFTYNGISLSSIDTDLIVAGLDANGNDSNILSRSVNRSDPTYDQPLTYDYGAVDSDVFSFEITILHQDAKCLTQETIRKIIGWLMSPVMPQLLTFTGCGGEVYEGIYYNGRFVSSRFEGYADLKYGITLEFKSSSPYAYSAEHTFTALPNTVMEIENTGTSVGKVILPKITIEPTGTGTVTINNLSDDLDKFSIDVINAQTVIVENHYCHLASGAIYPFEKVNNYNWVTIKDGLNRIHVTGPANVTFQLRFFEAIGV